MFTGNKDVDRLILLKVKDEREFLNLCSLNSYGKKLCNEDLFRERLLQNYPKSIEFKKEQTWKKYYLSLIYYIDKMKEKGFRFVDGNAKEYYDILQDEAGKIISVVTAVTSGFLDLVSFYLDDLKVDTREYDAKLDNNMLMAMAAENGHKNIVEYFIRKGANNFNQALAFATKRNKNLEIITLLLDKGADVNIGLREAARNSDIETIIFFIKRKGSKNAALKGAALGGRVNLVNFFIKEGATNVDEALHFAVLTFNQHPKESLEVIDYLISLGISPNIGFIPAVTTENDYLIKYFLDRGANEFIPAINIAEQNGDFALANFLRTLL
jgi:hypothetical protein